MDLPRVIKRSEIDSSQITPRGVEALEIADSNKAIWKGLLTDKQHRWSPQTANHVINKLHEFGYIRRKDGPPQQRRIEYVLTDFGRNVVSRLKVAKPGMNMQGLVSNMGGGSVRATWNDLGFLLTSGAYFSAPVGPGHEYVGIKSKEGDPVLGLETKICPKCGMINEDVKSCIRCGSLLVVKPKT